MQKSETLTRDELSDIESQVEEVTAELDEINDAIAELPEEDVTELGDVVDDLGAATDEIVEEVDGKGTEEDDLEPADDKERSRVLDIIGKGISSRGEEKVKKINST
ncbi:hypothetical protein EfsSVR2332_09690 [Enterococcus faecalis]|uniref:Uncharacterized protein n=1 Tax=Enterococcus faecalis TaxID=1351 RepID=A0AC59HMT1_ENTFL|nr:hypothetical protein EfsSVR2332_09690 [Enterococcus faecalis]